MRLIGITGGVGTGKSEILKFIAKHYKCKIYLADEVAHEIQKPGQYGYLKMIELMGNDILGPDKNIDRVKVAAKIFLDHSLRQKVNNIIHPAVRDFLENAVNEAKALNDIELFFIEAALLIENHYNEFVDEMWYIYASDATRKERLMQNRGYSEEKVNQIINSQLTEQRFREGSDFIIDNNESLEIAYQQIKNRLEAYTWVC